MDPITETKMKWPEMISGHSILVSVMGSILLTFSKCINKFIKVVCQKSICILFVSIVISFDWIRMISPETNNPNFHSS